jgi:hypothetical protein
VRRLFFLLAFLASAASLPASDFWQHPGAAEKNSLFINALMPSISFTEGFSLPPLQIGLDYMLPIPLPFSAGAFLKVPWPDLESFGMRVAYHINLGVKGADLFLLHVFEFRFSRAGENGENGVVTFRFLDFRVGARYFFGSYLALLVETDFLFQGITFGVSLKIF